MAKALGYNEPDRVDITTDGEEVSQEKEAVIMRVPEIKKPETNE